MKYLSKAFAAFVLISALSMSTFAGVIVSGDDTSSNRGIIFGDDTNSNRGIIFGDDNESNRGVIVSGDEENSDGQDGASNFWDWDYWF